MSRNAIFRNYLGGVWMMFLFSTLLLYFYFIFLAHFPGGIGISLFFHDWIFRDLFTINVDKNDCESIFRLSKTNKSRHIFHKFQLIFHKNPPKCALITPPPTSTLSSSVHMKSLLCDVLLRSHNGANLVD